MINNVKSNRKTWKMIKIKSLLIVLAVFLFVGCEGYVDYSGTIYDIETKEPIDSVKCIMVAHKNYTYSDSIGYYYVTTSMVNCVPNCGEYEVEFSKQGYKTQVIKAPTNVYLKKE
jgi:hypothetical protein